MRKCTLGNQERYKYDLVFKKRFARRAGVLRAMATAKSDDIASVERLAQSLKRELGSGVPLHDVKRAENELGRQLPEDLRAWHLSHGSKAVYGGYFYILSLEESMDQWRWFRAMQSKLTTEERQLDAQAVVDPGVDRAFWALPQWLPVCSNVRL